MRAFLESLDWLYMVSKSRKSFPIVRRMEHPGNKHGTFGEDIRLPVAEGEIFGKLSGVRAGVVLGRLLERDGEQSNS